ncbi:MAG: hypothetical protein NDJ89_15030 [Oligoflexia bacterium]|nr:hypothetical protein [Oligoflexia bacterium]
MSERESERGSIAVLLVLILMLVLFSTQELLSGLFLVQQNGQLLAQSTIAKRQLLSDLSELVQLPMTLRNSRFTINGPLRDCLSATPASCSEMASYDFFVYPPAPILTFTGAWIDPPASMQPVAGGRTAGKVFYNRAGGRCPPSVTSLDARCNFQVFARFVPLCGGTTVSPDFSVPGGAPCTSTAKGFRVTLGVVSLFNNRIESHNEATDRTEFVVSATTFGN